METLDRKQVALMALEYEQILKKESHHDHELIMDERGTIRWKKNNSVDKYFNSRNLNDIIMFFHVMDIDKNNELYRMLYRDLGYSLYGYWEVFYWEANNEYANDYNPPKKKVPFIKRLLSLFQ